MTSRIAFPYFDKAIHFLMYFALSAVSGLSLLKKKQSCRWRRFIKCLLHDRHSLIRLDISGHFWLFAGLFPAIYGGLTEIVQTYYSSSRTGDWFDFLADVAGVCCALWLFIGINFKLGKYEQERCL